MAGIITTGAHPKALWPGVKNWFGRAYESWEPQYTDLVTVETSDKAYEEEVESTGFGLATVKPHGDSVSYDTDSQGYVARYTHVAYGIGFIVTEEELEDNLYPDVSRRRAPELADSMNQTMENVVANKIANRAFTAGYTIGDGQVLCSPAHPSVVGSQSNILTNAADLSEPAIEDMITQIRNATNSRGLKKKIQPVSLHVPTALEWEAHRILDSVLQSNSAENNANVLRSTKALPGGIKVNTYFTSSTAWFIRTNVRLGNKMFMRAPVVLSQDNDFDTSNAKTKVRCRFSVGTSDWRGWYGTPGV
jgi:hypothetical protein